MHLISSLALSLLLLTLTTSIPVENVGVHDWHLQLVGVPIWNTKVKSSNLHLVITPTTYAALSAQSGELLWRRQRFGHRVTLLNVVAKHDYLMVLEAEADVVTAKLFRAQGGELIYDFPFQQRYDGPSQNGDDVYSGDIIKLKGKIYTFMKDEEAVRVLDQSRKTNDYRAEQGYKIKQAQLYEGQMQIIAYGEDDYKILTMELSKGGEVNVVEERKFMPDYGANIGLMMLMNRERLVIDAEIGLDFTEDEFIQIDRAGFFFAVQKKQKSRIQKLVFAGETPKAGGFEQKKILFEDSESSYLLRHKCEVAYTLQNNERELLWAEKCNTQDDTVSLKVSAFSLEDMKRLELLDIPKWSIENSRILGIERARNGGAQLLIEDSGFLIKVEVQGDARRSVMKVWERPQDLINTVSVAVYHEEEEQHKHYKRDVSSSWTEVPSLVMARYMQHVGDFMDFLNNSAEWFQVPKDKFRLEGLLLALTKHNRLYALKTEDHSLEWAVALGLERVEDARIVVLHGGKVLVLSRSRYSILSANSGRVITNEVYHPENEHVVVQQLEQTGQTVLLINKAKLTSHVIVQEIPHVPLPELDLMFITEPDSALKRIHLHNGKSKTLWSMPGQREPIATVTRDSQVEADLQLTQHGPSGEIIRKYVNSNSIMRVVKGEDDDDLEIQIIDAVTGRFLYKRILPQAIDPLLLIDENIYIVKFKSLESGADTPLKQSKSNLYDDEDDEDDSDFVKDSSNKKKSTNNPSTESEEYGIHGEQLLVIEMMEPFRNETVSGIVKSHLEAVDYSEFWKGVTEHVEEVSAYSRDDPIIHELAFILPLNARDVKSITMTQTSKGITGKYLLLATNAGEIVAIPRSYLIPSRRPLPKFSQFGVPQDSGEEGKFYYDAMVVSPPKMIVNYNLQILGLSGVYSFPTRMESTTIVVGIGGDIFYSKYAPERQFDKLTDKTGSWIMILVCILSVFLIKGSRWYLMRRTKKEMFLMS